MGLTPWLSLCLDEVTVGMEDCERHEPTQGARRLLFAEGGRDFGVRNEFRAPEGGHGVRNEFRAPEGGAWGAE